MDPSPHLNWEVAPFSGLGLAKQAVCFTGETESAYDDEEEEKEEKPDEKDEYDDSDDDDNGMMTFRALPGLFSP